MFDRVYTIVSSSGDLSHFHKLKRYGKKVIIGVYCDGPTGTVSRIQAAKEYADSVFVIPAGEDPGVYLLAILLPEDTLYRSCYISDIRGDFPGKQAIKSRLSIGYIEK